MKKTPVLLLPLLLLLTCCQGVAPPLQPHMQSSATTWWRGSTLKTLGAAAAVATLGIVGAAATGDAGVISPINDSYGVIAWGGENITAGLNGSGTLFLQEEHPAVNSTYDIVEEEKNSSHASSRAIVPLLWEDSYHRSLLFSSYDDCYNNCTISQNTSLGCNVTCVDYTNAPTPAPTSFAQLVRSKAEDGWWSIFLTPGFYVVAGYVVLVACIARCNTHPLSCREQCVAGGATFGKRGEKCCEHMFKYGIKGLLSVVFCPCRYAVNYCQKKASAKSRKKKQGSHAPTHYQRNKVIMKKPNFQIDSVERVTGDRLMSISLQTT